YLEANREKLEQAPLGLYAVVPPAESIPLAQPGVLFCLQHKGPSQTAQNEKVNPLSPYYLVYVHADGQVRLTFTQARTILNLFRELALGKSAPFTELCQLFDRQTNNGQSMVAYSCLLQKAVSSISDTFQKKLAAGLQSGR